MDTIALRFSPEPGQIVLYPMAPRVSLRYPLHRLVIEQCKAGAQDRMTGNDGIERRPQGELIESALQVPSADLVIGGASGMIDLVQKPEALLAE